MFLSLSTAATLFLAIKNIDLVLNINKLGVFRKPLVILHYDISWEILYYHRLLVLKSHFYETDNRYFRTLTWRVLVDIAVTLARK